MPIRAARGALGRGEPSSREAGHGSGTQLPERERLDDREQLTVVGVPHHDDRVRAPAGVCPRLGRNDVGVVVDGADRVERVAALPRNMRLLHRLCAACCLRAESVLERVDRVGKIDGRDDVGF